jgi:Uma2 family endonuclease
MAQRTDDGLVSVEAYLEMEERSEVRHEYVGGMLYAMVGGTDRHNRIAVNILRKLADAAEDGPCRVYINDMRFRIDNVYYYPDVMVACEPPETENPTWRTNPCLVVEVLSPTSVSTDQREKLLAYRSVPTVETYLIVHQDIHRVERHFRNQEGEWARADHVKDGYIPVPCLDTRLTLAEIYRGLS